MELEAITAQLTELSKTISKTLNSNGFEEGFIIEAKIYIFISQKNKSLKLLSGTGRLKDIDGKVYEGKPITEKAYNKPFYSFPKKKKLNQNKLKPQNKFLNGGNFGNNKLCLTLYIENRALSSKLKVQSYLKVRQK